MRNSTWFLAVILLSFPILSCSYWWFMSQVSTLDAKVMCNSAGLVKKQRQLCEEYPETAISIGKGAKLAVGECQKQLKEELWNCSIVARDISVFGKVLRKASRETAFIYAITSSGVVHEITKACARGELRDCVCNKTLLHGRNGRGFEWGGCNDNIEYGLKYASKFIDSREKEQDVRAKINLHNNFVGRRAVKIHMKPVCKCHGVSSSCAYKTCFRKMGPFGEVGAYLRDKYHNALRATVHQSQNQPVAVDGKNTEKLLQDLLFLVESPDYCLPNPSTGSLGTTERPCYKTAPGPGSCRILCCGRGYNTLQVQETYDCTCKFHWCCQVNCRTCGRIVEKYVCR